jgi:hypothetical protein
VNENDKLHDWVSYPSPSVVLARYMLVLNEQDILISTYCFSIEQCQNQRQLSVREVKAGARVGSGAPHFLLQADFSRFLLCGVCLA